MIVGRGGGSIEDLWAFNEEPVARAIFDCSVPVISAVGHETDTTIADFVADLRAPTPSAAAELAVYDYREAKERIYSYQDTLQRQVSSKISEMRTILERLQLRLNYAHPRQKLNESRQYAADLETRIRQLMNSRLDREKHRLALCAERMKGLSPLEKLSHGYSYVQNLKGENIRSIRQVGEGTELEIYVSDGRIRALVTGAGGRNQIAEKGGRKVGDTANEIEIKEETAVTAEETDKKENLEEMFQDLEKVIKDMENSDVTLEQSFDLYNRGMNILKECSRTIDEVEKKVLVLDEDGATHEF